MESSTLDKALIENIFDSSDLSFIDLMDNSAIYEQVIKEVDYLPVLYSYSSIKYQFLYHKETEGEWIDLSKIIYWDNRPVGLWPISISLKENNFSINSQGWKLLPPILVGHLSDKSKRKIFISCLEILFEIKRILKVSSISAIDQILVEDNKSIGDWHDQLLNKGAVASVRYQMYVDLSPKIEQIRNSFRKGHRAAVKEEKLPIEARILTKKDNKIWATFQSFHETISGRKTRSDDTWDLQLDQIDSGNAFFVYLLDESKEMIGGGLFNTSKDEAFYGVGVYNRDLFDKPLGHLVQFAAMKECKNRNINWFWLGEMLHLSYKPKPSEKELSISHFKKGFASHIFPNYLLKIE